MFESHINKGVGRGVEVYGLRAQYIFIFTGGIIGTFVLYVILHAVGVHWVLNLALGLFLLGLNFYKTFELNRKHGPHGLMKLSAVAYRGRYLKGSRMYHKRK